MAQRIVFIVLISLAFLVAGCTNNLPGTCYPKGDSCCKLGVCTVTDASCMQGTQPTFSGCDEKCMPIVECKQKP